MKLFAIGNGSVSDYLRSNISSLKDKIASYTDEQIMNSDFDEWVEYLTKKYQVEPITFFVNATTRSLHETTIQQYNPWSRMGSAYGEPEYYNLDGYNIDFKIPFAGDSILLKCQPSTYTFTSYEIVDFQRSTESSYGYITIRLSYTNQEIKSFGEQLEEKIDTAFKNRFKNFEETSGYVNNEVRSYNEQLESTVRQLLNERKNKASDFFSISKALKIPLNLNSSAPNLTPIPLKKPHRANLNEPKQHAPEKQYYIDDADFENIVRIPVNSGTFASGLTAPLIVSIPVIKIAKPIMMVPASFFFSFLENMIKQTPMSARTGENDVGFNSCTKKFPLSIPVRLKSQDVTVVPIFAPDRKSVV